jgi:hypothetical protein
VSYGRIIGAVAVVVIGAAFVVGCGDDGEGSSSVTKAEFIKEAEAICKERKEEWDAVAAAFTEKTEAEGEVGFKKAQERTNAFVRASILPLLEEEQAALEDLETPEGDEAKIETMLQNRSRGLEKLEDKGAEGLLERPFLVFEKEAKAYGLSCTLE